MQATRLAPSPSVDPEATDEGAEVGPTGVALAQASRGGQQAAPWLVAGQRAVPLREFSADRPFGRASSLTELIEHWSDHESGIRALTSLPQTRQRIATAGEQITSLDFQAPIRPRRIFCTIGNYRRQVVEAAVDADDQADAAQRRAAILDALAQRARAGQPYVCLTSADRIGNPTGTLTIETGIDTLDWEVEIAVVVGAGAYRLSTDQAQGVIAGYCVANDLTIRSRVTRPDLPALGSDWLQSKGMAGSLPLGPWLVPAWQLPDPSGLRLRLSVNGAVMQNDTAEDMVFGIDRQVAYLSQHTALQPGDVLCTGSPAGFGVHHGRFLRAGDEIKAWVSGLGAQRLRCVGEGARAPIDTRPGARRSAAARPSTAETEHTRP